MFKKSVLNIFKSHKNANQNRQEVEFDLSSVEFPVIDPTIISPGRRRMARTGVFHKPKKPKTDYSNNNYRVVHEETRNMNNEVVDSYYFVYRVYSTGGQKRVCNEDEINWAVSRAFNQ